MMLSTLGTMVSCIDYEITLLLNSKESDTVENMAEKVIKIMNELNEDLELGFNFNLLKNLKTDVMNRIIDIHADRKAEEILFNEAWTNY